MSIKDFFKLTPSDKARPLVSITVDLDARTYTEETIWTRGSWRGRLEHKDISIFEHQPKSNSFLVREFHKVRKASPDLTELKNWRSKPVEIPADDQSVSNARRALGVEFKLT
ncbi:MAG: hypothetical protein K9G62_03995 [Alphaproteobacteria bacterium]|nr:hypothetical protein [Alphaproteobacteria bacterium]